VIPYTWVELVLTSVFIMPMLATAVIAIPPPVEIIITISLIVLSAVGVLVSANGNPRMKPFSRSLNILLIPLLLAFVVMTILRLL